MHLFTELTNLIHPLSGVLLDSNNIVVLDRKGEAPPGAPLFAQMMAWLRWMSLACLVAAVMFAGVRMGLNSRKGDGAEHATSIGWIIMGAILISSAVTLITMVG